MSGGVGILVLGTAAAAAAASVAAAAAAWCVGSDMARTTPLCQLGLLLRDVALLASIAALVQTWRPSGASPSYVNLADVRRASTFGGSAEQRQPVSSRRSTQKPQRASPTASLLESSEPTIVEEAPPGDRVAYGIALGTTIANGIPLATRDGVVFTADVAAIISALPSRLPLSLQPDEDAFETMSWDDGSQRSFTASEASTCAPL